jgi:hypothetical protein
MSLYISLLIYLFPYFSLITFKVILMNFLCTNSGASFKLFCIDCKYFQPGDYSNEFGKCLLFPRIIDDDNFLVTGVNKISEVTYNYCSTCRTHDDMCGEYGIFYKKKYIRKNK